MTPDELIPYERYVRRVFLGTLVLTLAAAVALHVAGLRDWSRGVVLGGSASLAGLVIMARDVRRQGTEAGGVSFRPGYGGYALRMAITAAALVYAATSARVALWAAIPAIFAAQFVMTVGELAVGRGPEPGKQEEKSNG